MSYSIVLGSVKKKKNAFFFEKFKNDLSSGVLNIKKSLKSSKIDTTEIILKEVTSIALGALGAINSPLELKPYVVGGVTTYAVIKLKNIFSKCKEEIRKIIEGSPYSYLYYAKEKEIIS